MSDLPEPLTPPDCDLRDFAFMPIDVRRLLTSETWLTATGDEKAAAMTLWLESWHQVPAGSLPENPKMLAILSQAGGKWGKVKTAAMRGWVKCSDGRLYHPVVCEKAVEAWKRRCEHRARLEKARAVKASRQDGAVTASVTEPEIEPVIASITEPVTAPVIDTVTGPVTGLKGQGQGQGQGQKDPCHGKNSGGPGTNPAGGVPAGPAAPSPDDLLAIPGWLKRPKAGEAA